MILWKRNLIRLTRVQGSERFVRATAVTSAAGRWRARPFTDLVKQTKKQTNQRLEA